MRWDNLRLDEPLETGDGGDLFTAARDGLHTSGDTKGGNLAMIEQSFYPVRYALGQSAAR
jgi:hypothetical protein